MSKEELFKKYQEILLKTNGGADDYVVALCQISNLIKDYAEEKDQQIAEFQKQLEGKNKTIQGLIETQKYLEKSASYQMFLDIQKQLEEKEKEISEYIKIVDDLHKQLSDKCDFCDKTNQDKISFTLEQLEKLKKFTEKEIKECNKLLQEEFEDDCYIQSVNARQSMCYEFKREIDNQINGLKGEK